MEPLVTSPGRDNGLHKNFALLKIEHGVSAASLGEPYKLEDLALEMFSTPPFPSLKTED